MLNRILMALIFIFISRGAYAEEFVSVYTDPNNNLSWSSALSHSVSVGNDEVQLQLYHSNGCERLVTNDHGSTTSFGHLGDPKCTFEMKHGVYVFDDDGNRMVNIDDSSAARACKDLTDRRGKKLGARLPTKSEIESLIRSFKSVAGAPLYTEESCPLWKASSSSGRCPTLTLEGRKAMNAKFGDMEYPFGFLSSSVVPESDGYAFEYNNFDGSVDEYYRGNVDSVRCVVVR